jgi:hypothetical protein
VARRHDELDDLAADGGDSEDLAAEEPSLGLRPVIGLETLYFFE